MKKQFGKLPKAKQEGIELEYHQMNPAKFDEQMSMAKKHVADSIRLPREMVETLRVMAESEGERGDQTMVRKWTEQRLHHSDPSWFGSDIPRHIGLLVGEPGNVQVYIAAGRVAYPERRDEGSVEVDGSWPDRLRGVAKEMTAKLLEAVLAARFGE